MAANLGLLIGGSFKKACDERIDVGIERIRIDRDKVGQARYGMRANFGIWVLGEHDELRNHKVKGKRSVDLDIEFSGVIFTCLFENIKSSLRKLLRGFSNLGCGCTVEGRRGKKTTSARANPVIVIARSYGMSMALMKRNQDSYRAD